MKKILLILSICLGLFASDEIELNTLKGINFSSSNNEKLILSIDGDVPGINSQIVNQKINENCALSFSVRSSEFNYKERRLYPSDAAVVCKNNSYSVDLYDPDAKKGIRFGLEGDKFKRELKELTYIANDENIIIEYPYKPKQVKINGINITIVAVNVVANPVIIFEDKIHSAVVKYVKESRIVTLKDEFKIEYTNNKALKEQYIEQLNKLNPNIEIKRSYLEYLINSDDSWKKELDIKKGILNKLSKNSEKFFCENSKSVHLKNEILETLKYQDMKYYEDHKNAIDNLPTQLINSTLKENTSCHNGYIVTGNCGNWKCSKAPSQDEIKKYVDVNCSKLEKNKNENDSEYSQRLSSCLTVHLIQGMTEFINNRSNLLNDDVGMETTLEPEKMKVGN